MQEGLLPDAVTMPLLWVGLAVNLSDGFVPIQEAVIGAMVGYGFLWLVSHAVKRWTGQDGIGFGDRSCMRPLVRGLAFTLSASSRALVCHRSASCGRQVAIRKRQ